MTVDLAADVEEFLQQQVRAGVWQSDTTRKWSGTGSKGTAAPSFWSHPWTRILVARIRR